MPADSLQMQVERKEGGQFKKGQSGNPAGREVGSRNRATLLAEQLFDGECEALTKKAVAMALAGDAATMRLCIDRILAPRRGRGVRFELPVIHSAADLAPAMAAITEAAALGILSSGEAFELAQVVDTFIRAIEAGDIERRLRQVENVNGLGESRGLGENRG